MPTAANTVCETPKPVKYTPIQLKRFWKKVDKSGGVDSCWNWIAGRFKGGYGAFWVNRKLTKSHRISWIIHFGKIPDGFLVCHHCDNPRCVNPAHLFSGSPQDNMTDKKLKGRCVNPTGEKSYWHGKKKPNFSGEHHPNSKLKNDDTLKIKSMLERNFMPSKIARFFGVSAATISDIKYHRTWKSVK